MAKDEPRNKPTLDFVERLEGCLDIVRGDLKAAALERLDENASADDIKRAVIAAAGNLTRIRSSKDTTPVLTEDESHMFETINDHLSAEKRARWDQLVAKRDAEDLTDDERQELISLGEELERLNVRRLRAINDLAKLKGVEFETVCEKLGIAPI